MVNQPSTLWVYSLDATETCACSRWFRESAVVEIRVTIQNANAIIQRIGPCRIALDQTAFPELSCELTLMGCETTDVSTGFSTRSHGLTAGFLSWTNPYSKPAFTAALRPFRDMDVLVLQSEGQDRSSIEHDLFEAGWQRHPAGMMSGEYPNWTATSLPGATIWQRARGKDCHWLQKGVAADPLIARYATAANHVRPGDRVLVDGKGAADGAAILEALSRAGSVVRVDTNRAKAGGETVDAQLSRLADESIDLIVAIEPSVPTDWVARLDDYARLLKYDGRIVIGWQQGGADDKRPANWDDFSDAVSERFLPETRYVQIAVSPNPQGPHAIFPVEAEQPAATDWLMLVASVNPLLGAGHAESYDHPAFSRAKGDLPALVDFGAAYDNPWLYRSMVQMGERLSHDVKLARLAECVIEDAREDSADRGAAIAVLGYRVLEMRRADLAQSVLPLIAAYVGVPLTDETPVHVRRWRISLAFLAGRLTELSEDRVAAKRWYREAAEADWSEFSPLLATKSIAASFYEARIHLADGDPQTALACFRHGADTAMKAAAFPHDQQMGPDGQPLPFYLQELAEVIDMGSQCANALAHFPLWQRDPGLFWRQVDMRRFGLASWARDLERGNERLRAA